MAFERAFGYDQLGNFSGECSPEIDRAGAYWRERERLVVLDFDILGELPFAFFELKCR